MGTIFRWVRPSKRSLSTRKSSKTSTSSSSTSCAVGDDLAPVGQPGLVQAAFHQPEVRGVQVGPDQEPVALMLDAVFHVPLPGLEHPELAGGIVGLEQPALRC